MNIIAHRGYSAKYPENTLLAYKKAIELGVYAIEVDLRLSADGEVVLFHDESLKRITGIYKSINTLTLEEIKLLDAGSGEKIPTLDELISLAYCKVMLILEIKFDPYRYKKICQIVEQKIKDKLEWIEVSCFEDSVLEYMHKLNPQIKLHKVIEEDYILRNIYFKKKNYDHISCFDIDVALQDVVLELSLLPKHKIIFWTVEDEDIKTSEKLGLFAVMRNDPSKT